MAKLTVQDMYDRLELGKTVGQNTQDDAWMQRKLNWVTQSITDYIGRDLEVKTYTDKWVRPTVVFAQDFPIVAASVTVTRGSDTLTENQDYIVNYATGQVLYASSGFVQYDGAWRTPADLKLQYQAGFATLPEDIARVYERVIGGAWNKRSAAGGTEAGAIGTGKMIKRVSMADVGAIDYRDEIDIEASGGSNWLAGFPLDALGKYVLADLPMHNAARPWQHVQVAVT